MTLNDNRLVGRRNESRRRISFGREPFRYCHFLPNGDEPIGTTADPADDTAGVRAEHRMVTEPHQLDSIRVYICDLARFTKDRGRGIGVELGAFRRHHAV
ncbi:hypothetical protein [Streptomyces sp. NPDC088733]|uniref:hypothetical protein n=1 Tax=Streptomyces sp. NPDC088733 TaxID=3365880 RepID=UPI0038135083